MTQRSFAEALKPVYMPHGRKLQRSAPLDPKEISVLCGQWQFGMVSFTK
jgi:hypothetical protein